MPAGPGLPALAGLDLGGYTSRTAAGEISGDSQELLAGLAVARLIIYPQLDEELRMEGQFREASD